MRWAVTKSCIAVGDPAPTSEDTVYNLELLERQSQSLFVKKPGGNRSVEFTRPGAQPSSSSRRRSDSRSRSRSQSRSTQPGLPRLPVNHIPAGIYEPSLPPGVAMKEGDWFCPNCEAHNFKRNMSCHDCTSWKPGCEPAADDWQCPKCNNVNFGDRIVCNMRKCGAPRPGTELAENETDFLSNLLEGGEGAATKKSAIEQRQDSWSCLKCGNLNFGDRAYCNMRKCGAPKPLPERGHLEQGWQCSACGNSNFADRQYCNLRKCGAPRPGFQQMPWPNLEMLGIGMINPDACSSSTH